MSDFDDVQILRQYFDEIADCEELKATPLPSADLIWWRSQLAGKRELARRSVRAINAVRLAAVIVSLTFVAVAMVLWAPQVFGDLPLPLTMLSLLLFACSTGGVLFAWARQR